MEGAFHGEQVCEGVFDETARRAVIGAEFNGGVIVKDAWQQVGIDAVDRAAIERADIANGLLVDRFPKFLVRYGAHLPSDRLIAARNLHKSNFSGNRDMLDGRPPRGCGGELESLSGLDVYR